MERGSPIDVMTSGHPAGVALIFSPVGQRSWSDDRKTGGWPWVELFEWLFNSYRINSIIL